MSYPQHPETIILKNSFYKKGLTELDIWNYYQKVKYQLLQEVRGRDLMFFIMVDVNKPIIRRTGKETKFIRLNISNYDELITGRTISIHTAMKRIENIFIVDIDTDDFRQAKIAAIDTYNVISRNPYIDDISIRYSGKTSFHIFCNLKRNINIDTIRVMFKNYLLESELKRKYTVSNKRTKGIVNLDLAPDKYRGNFIALNSLSILGLRCMKLFPTEVLGFQKERATI